MISLTVRTYVVRLFSDAVSVPGIVTWCCYLVRLSGPVTWCCYLVLLPVAVTWCCYLGHQLPICLGCPFTAPNKPLSRKRERGIEREREIEGEGAMGGDIISLDISFIIHDKQASDQLIG